MPEAQVPLTNNRGKEKVLSGERIGRNRGPKGTEVGQKRGMYHALKIQRRCNLDRCQSLIY